MYVMHCAGQQVLQVAVCLVAAVMGALWSVTCQEQEGCCRAVLLEGQGAGGQAAPSPGRVHPHKAQGCTSCAGVCLWHFVHPHPCMRSYQRMMHERQLCICFCWLSGGEQAIDNHIPIASHIQACISNSRLLTNMSSKHQSCVFVGCVLFNQHSP